MTLCVFIHFSKKVMSLGSTTTSLIHRGGSERNFLNTWECQLVFLITYWVRFTQLLNIHGGEQKKAIISHSQTLLKTKQFLLSFAASLWTPCAAKRPLFLCFHSSLSPYLNHKRQASPPLCPPRLCMSVCTLRVPVISDWFCINCTSCRFWRTMGDAVPFQTTIYKTMKIFT